MTWSGRLPLRCTRATLLVLGSLVALPAAAQTRDPAAATELFNKGRSAMKQQDFATACAAFADSARFDPKVGTLLNLADCEEHLGKLVSARAHWQQAADLALANHDARENVARQRFMAIDPRVAKLVVRLAPQAPPGAVVRRDEVELGVGSLGVPLPADPGPHTVVVSAPGFETSTTTLTLNEGDVREVVASPGASLTPIAPPAPPVPRAPARSGTTQKVLAVVSAAVGAGGLAVGTIFGVNAHAANDASFADNACDAMGGCTSAGLAKRSEALTDGNVSTIAFIAGGALMAAGVVLWLTAPGGSGATAPRTGLLVSPGAVGMQGSF